MKINKLINMINNKINTIKIEKHQKELNRLVNTDGLKKHHDALNEIGLAKETIANFAKNNTVTVDIFDTSSTISRTQHIIPEFSKSADDCITIRVSDMLTGRAKDAIMPADTKQTYIYTRSNTRLLEDVEAGTEYIHQGYISHEDNFLKMLYRNISNLTNAVKGKNS